MQSLLACKIPEPLTKGCRFGLLIILFQKVDSLRLLKIYIMSCTPPEPNTRFFRLQPMDYNIHRCSRYMLLLNVNRINQTGFFQTYLHHHSLHQCYPLNFHMIHLCTRHTKTHILNHVFDMNINFYGKQFLRVIYIYS